SKASGGPTAPAASNSTSDVHSTSGLRPRRRPARPACTAERTSGDVTWQVEDGRVSTSGDPTGLARFGPATRAWFSDAFAGPTAAQAGAWEAISAGRHALVVAPTGSGKTLAAFLWALDRLATEPATVENR